jgi:hypothetical protein
MWVIVNETTGYEIDREVNYKVAKAIVSGLNESDQWGYTYGLRWED